MPFIHDVVVVLRPVASPPESVGCTRRWDAASASGRRQKLPSASCWVCFLGPKMMMALRLRRLERSGCALVWPSSAALPGSGLTQDHDLLCVFA